jgi:cytochrome c oxidase assembly protein subunit 15
VTLWIALGLLRAPAPPAPRALVRGAGALAVLVFVTMLAGGFVAGTDAGLIYNSFPWMGDGLMPSDYRNPALRPLANAFENPAAVQFHHRALAVASVLAIGAVWFAARQRLVSRAALDGLAVMALAQAGLGIATLLLRVPTALAALHQAGAVALLTLALLTVHGLAGAGQAAHRV